MNTLVRLLSGLLISSALLACSNSNNNGNPAESTVSPPTEPPVMPPVMPPEPPASLFSQQTLNIPSAATPAFTPGTPGVVVDNEKLLRQFGASEINFNQARYPLLPVGSGRRTAGWHSGDGSGL